MRILLHVNSHLPSIGGRELVVHNLALQYLHKGHEVVVAGPAGFRRRHDDDYGYPVVRWPTIRKFPVFSRAVSFGAWGLTHPAVDVIHSHATFPCGYVSELMRLLIGGVRVLTPHGEDINVIPEIGFGLRLDPARRRKIEFTVRNAEATTAISETILTSLLDSGAPAERLRVIPNGVDMARFDGTCKENIRSRLNLPLESRLVVSIGNYHPRKGQEVLVDAVRRVRRNLPNVVLVIVGRTSAQFCERVCASEDGAGTVFSGALAVPKPGSDSEDLLADLLRSADIYVSSSIDEGAEGLSLALLEGMAAGACPVVTNISGNRDVVQDNINGRLVPPGDSEALSGAIQSLLVDEVVRQRLSKQAQKTAESFSWSRVADQYLDLYGELLATASSRSKSQ